MIWLDKIYIKVDKKTGMIYLENTVIGRDKENLQQELIFSFENGFVGTKNSFCYWRCQKVY